MSEPPAQRRAVWAGRAGLAATTVSVALTFTVAVAGPSVMEPALPGRAGQPPWALAAHLSPAVAIALTAAALAAGTVGLGLCLHAARRGWLVPPWGILAAGLAAAAALALTPPFGSSDHLSYAAYGRMVVTGHDPYTTTPAALARLGDPVARAVQDWRHSPSVYGGLATGVQALASLAGGASARLTVFALSVAGLAAFAGTGLLAHLLARGDRCRQLRAALLWTCNPLLLQVLVAGAHVDALAIVSVVAAIAVMRFAMPSGSDGPRPRRRFAAAGVAGAACGLAAAVKVPMALVAVGLAAAAVLGWRAHGGAAAAPWRLAWRRAGPTLAALGAGLAVTAAVAMAPWGAGSLSPALRAGRYVSIGSPWRGARAALRLAMPEATADNLARAAAVALAVALFLLFTRQLAALAAGRTTDPAGLIAASVFAAGFSWLLAWPYVLPWYDSLAWAPLAIMPWLPAPWAALDWLVLARTAGLAFGYLPARGIPLPGGLGWLQPVVRTGVTPVVLLAVAAAVIALLWPRHPGRARA